MKSTKLWNGRATNAFHLRTRNTQCNSTARQYGTAFVTMMLLGALGYSQMMLFQSTRENEELLRSTINSSTRISGGSSVISRSNMDNKKYLLYFAKEGWSNQELCLKNAYFMARATNRILITAPILPHSNWGLYFENNLTASLLEGKVDIPNTGGKSMPHSYGKGENVPDTSKLVDYYLQNVPLPKYLPMGNVVDLEYTLPNVTTIDFRDYYQNHWLHNQDNIKDWVMERNHSHHNTLWIKDRPDLENRDDVVYFKHYNWEGTIPLDWFTLREDIGRVAEQNAHTNLWTFFDSFEPMFDESVLPQQYFRFRFSPLIRRTGKMILDNWGNVPYAAVHVRAGGDDEYGCFMNDEFVQKMINSTMDRILSKMENWCEGRRQAKEKLPRKVGLFIATDSLDELKANKWPAMVAQKTNIQQTMKKKYGVAVAFFDSSTFQYGKTRGYKEHLKKEVIYPGIFLDQHMAACAELGFVGTDDEDCFSTFSQLIWNIRRSPEACLA